jgi:hypothetical protein
MRIEHWELNIGQIFPNLHRATLFLREPLAVSGHFFTYLFNVLGPTSAP